MNKEKKCIFCDWERLCNQQEIYDFDYICDKCKVKCGLEEKNEKK